MPHLRRHSEFDQGGVQYDHVNDYAITQVTDPETGKPTHPFCNRYKKLILAYREGKERTVLPRFGSEKQVPSVEQLRFWGDDEFPG